MPCGFSLYIQLSLHDAGAPLAFGNGGVQLSGRVVHQQAEHGEDHAHAQQDQGTVAVGVAVHAADGLADHVHAVVEGHEEVELLEQHGQHMDGIGAAGARHLDHHDDDGGGHAHVVQGVDQTEVHHGEVQRADAAGQHEPGRLHALDAHEVQAAEGGHQRLGHSDKEEQHEAAEVPLYGTVGQELGLGHRHLDHHRRQQRAHEQRQHDVVGGHGGAVITDLIGDLGVQLYGGGQIVRQSVRIVFQHIRKFPEGRAVGDAAHVRLHVRQIAGHGVGQCGARRQRGLGLLHGGGIAVQRTGQAVQLTGAAAQQLLHGAQGGKGSVVLLVNKIVDILVALQSRRPDGLAGLRQPVQQLVLDVQITGVGDGVPQIGELFDGSVDLIRQIRRLHRQILQAGDHVVDLPHELLLQQGGILGSAPLAQLILQIHQTFVDGVEDGHHIAGGAVSDIGAGGDHVSHAAHGVGGVHQHAVDVIHSDGRRRQQVVGVIHDVLQRGQDLAELVHLPLGIL